MTPQKQLNRFGMGNGQTGDCHRTCIAMILNMHRDDVPHFMDGVPPGLPADHPLSLAAEKREVDWLAKRRLTPVSVPFPGEFPLDLLLEQYKALAKDSPFILGCTSGLGTAHSVVIHKGEVYNPNDGYIDGPMPDGHWWLTFYAVGPKWRSLLPSDLWRALVRLFASR